MFRRTVREWCQKELHPNAEEWEANRLFPNSVFRASGKLGLLGIRVPESTAGLGSIRWYTTCYAEEMVHCEDGRSHYGTHAVQSDMALRLSPRLGTITCGRIFSSRRLKETLASHRVFGTRCGIGRRRIERRPAGTEMMINGAKTYITNGIRRSFILMAVRTGGKGFGGIDLVLFPTDTPGFKVTNKLEKVGNHCSDAAEIAFEDCRIPVRNLLGQENAGFYYIMQNKASVWSGLCLPLAGRSVFWI